MTQFEAAAGGDLVTEGILTVISTMGEGQPGPGAPLSPSIDEEGLSRLSVATHPYHPAERIGAHDLAYLSRRRY